MTGYFAFPLGQSPTSVAEVPRVPFSSAENLTRESALNPDAGPQSSDQSDRIKKRKAQREITEEKRRARLERERQEIYLSELAWVRSGGILRDAKGRRDKARTEELRREIRLQDEERRIMEQWHAYETRLRALQLSGDPITWEIIPWPVVVAPSSPLDLEPSVIADFIFATFKVRGVSIAKKERLRTSFLRWHPDKFAALMSRVPEHEQDRVIEGVNAVFRSLRQLQDMEKQST